MLILEYNYSTYLTVVGSPFFTIVIVRSSPLCPYDLFPDRSRTNHYVNSVS